MLNRPVKILLYTNAIILISAAMLGPIYALFVEEVGGDLLSASLTAATFSVAAGITVYLTGVFSDRVKENELLVVLGYLIISLGFFLYIFVDSIWFLLIVQALMGFGEAIYSPSFDALYSKHIDGQRRGTQWGAWESMNYFTQAVGAIIGGFLAAQFGFITMFIIMGLLSFLSAIYIYMLPRRVL